MSNSFHSFQKFQEMELAKEIAGLLHTNGIAFEIEDHNQIFDPSFANNRIEPNIILKVRQNDFKKANDILYQYYAQQLDSVENDHYLFEFSDGELEEIIAKPDEWGKFDYLLAQKLLKERGKEISTHQIDSLKVRRIDELSKPEEASVFWIVLGYISAVFGGFFGFIIGWILAYFKKTLPDGQRVFNYKESDRKHGKIIFYLSFVGFGFWFLRKFTLI